MTCLICRKNFSGDSNFCPDCIALMEKGAKQGDARIQCHLGRCYLDGDGVSQNYEQAVNLFQKSAEQGYGLAQTLLGNCYRDGIGVPKNKEKAIYWFKESAENGYAPAQYGLCLCYFFDSPNECKDDAIFWCKKAAEQGNIQAQVFLGNCYKSGINVEKDIKKSIYWLEKASDNDLAQLLLGHCYFYGEGVPEDKEKAVCWYKKSAEQGNSYAQFLLAGCYSFGDGTQKDKKQSEYWYSKSEEQKKIDLKNNQGKNLEFLLSSITGTWQERFMERVWQSGKTEVAIYKKADMSKQHFSKIRSNKNYSPKKETVLALAIGLELGLEEAVKFLAEAGYAFSDINPTDMIVRGFISKKQYDIAKINDFLFEKNLPLIGNTRNSERNA